MWQNERLMPTVRSFAKINLGLCIGPLRPDGFHALRTIYQTIALHDTIHVQVSRGSGIEIRCADSRVPQNEANTCYRVVQKAMSVLDADGKVVIEIEKKLPVQGGLGGASANAVAALLALERALKKQLPGPEKLRIAAEVGSDLPLFLIGGTTLGVGRGEEVYSVPDMSAVPCVIATPEVGVSTPKAFADWDLMMSGRVPDDSGDKLTPSSGSDRMLKFGRMISMWLNSEPQHSTGKILSGVPASGRGRAGNPLLDLVRTGIENDFERVVFPQHPELREVKSLLLESGAFYASLSGSGSALYGLFRSGDAAKRAAAKLFKKGTPAVATSTLTRQQYWKKLLVSGF